MASLTLQKRLYTAEEAGAYLGGLSPWVVRKMVRDGVLPFVPAGKKKLLDVKDLDRWIDGAKERHVQ
jgi:excisionase family DNA binding protein